MQAPCKNCPDRRVTTTENCHSTCEKYLEYKEFRKQYLAKRREENHLDEYIIDSIAKRKP